MLVENSTDSHKPVEIGNLRAQSASVKWRGQEGLNRNIEAVRGDPRGWKRLFSEA